MTSPAAWASTWVGDTGWWLFCDINRQNIGSADAGCWGRVESLAPRRRQLLTGLVPAAVPYFVLERHFSYVEASGLVLAATLGSALPQPAVGFLADRHRLPWLSPLGGSPAA